MFKEIILATHHALQWIFIQLICLYQKCISPFFGNHCRFYPSCSQYAHDVMHVYPIFTALFLIIKRIARCNPFHAGGFDPITHTGTLKRRYHGH